MSKMEYTKDIRNMNNNSNIQGSGNMDKNGNIKGGRSMNKTFNIKSNRGVGRALAVMLAMVLCLGFFTAIPANAATASYPDVPLSSSWAKPVYWASGRGYVQGYANGNFGPSDNCTRAQIVTFFYRYYRDVKGEDVTTTLPGASGTSQAGVGVYEHTHNWVAETVHYPEITHTATTYYSGVTKVQDSFETIRWTQCTHCGAFANGEAMTRDEFIAWLDAHAHGSTRNIWQKVPPATGAYDVDAEGVETGDVWGEMIYRVCNKCGYREMILDEFGNFKEDALNRAIAHCKSCCGDYGYKDGKFSWGMYQEGVVIGKGIVVEVEPARTETTVIIDQEAHDEVIYRCSICGAVK